MARGERAKAVGQKRQAVCRARVVEVYTAKFGSPVTEEGVVAAKSAYLQTGELS